MICATCVVVAAVVAADPAEFQTVARGRFCQSAAFSPDSQWIVSLRREDPVPPLGEATYHIDLWKVAEIDTFDGTGTQTPPPTVTTELKGCASPGVACFSKDGEIVVLARESQKNGFYVGSGVHRKAVTPIDATEAKRLGRRVGQFARPVILFLGRDDLIERRRWVDDQMDDHSNLDMKVIWFPAGRTVVHFVAHGVRLLDDATGEEFDRLKFELDRPNDPWHGLGDAQITPVDAPACVIAASARQRHAVWKLTADRNVTKLAEVTHPGIAGDCAVSPLGNVVAVAASSSDYKYGRNPPPISETNSRGSFELWSVESRKPESKLLADDMRVRDAMFSPDGKRLVVLDVGEFFDDPAAPPKEPGRSVRMGRYSADILLWDVATGRKLLRRPLGKTCPVSIRFSPNGRRLLTMEEIDEENWGSRIRLWDLDQMLKAEGLSPSRPRL